MNFLFDEEFPRHCEVQTGELEGVGAAVEVLGRTKIRLEDTILTEADPKHVENIKTGLSITAKDRSEVPSKQLDLLNLEPLSEDEATRFRSAVELGRQSTFQRTGETSSLQPRN